MNRDEFDSKFKIGRFEKNLFPTLEEVKKIWKSKGWFWYERDDYHNGKDYRMYIVKKFNDFPYSDHIDFFNYDLTYRAYSLCSSLIDEDFNIPRYEPLKLDIETQTLIVQTLTAMRGDEK